MAEAVPIFEKIPQLAVHAGLRLGFVIEPDEKRPDLAYYQQLIFLGNLMKLPMTDIGTLDELGAILQTYGYLDDHGDPTREGCMLLAELERDLDKKVFPDPKEAHKRLEQIHTEPVVCDDVGITLGSYAVSQNMLRRLQVIGVQDGVLQRKKVTVSALGAVCVDPAAFDLSSLPAHKN